MRLRCALLECCFAGTSDALPEFDIHSKLLNLGYTELVNATRHFHPSKDLGWRTYGKVYYGILEDLREVAIERCSRQVFCRIQERLQDSSILSLLPHKNLVSIYGYASSGEDFLLAHEYIPNGTLRYHLYGEGSKSIMLPWHTRLDIAIDAADALAYLHSNGIIHSRVTSGNILLDENLSVKVQGFLLSWQLPRGPSGFVAHIQLDGIRRRRGYLDPEYLTRGILSLKSDVYSFGVVLCELLSSKPAMVWDHERRTDMSLIDFAVSKIQNHALEELLDPNLGFESNSNPGIKQMLTSMAVLAYQCLNDEPSLRPSMEQVLEGLKGIREGKRDSNLTADLERQTPKEAFFQDHIKPKLQIFSHAVLAEATNHFEECLGQGGFGVVYYGNLPDGREVAIKCFREKKDKTIQQFMKEIEILCHVRHPNLVSLYGCSSNQDYQLHLVYEYVSDGSLESHLRPNSGNQLAWFTRLNIAIETARALSYLHHSGIIHRDVKPSNILLDESLGVKVADFGLARFLPLVANASRGDFAFASHASTIPVGTPAYIDPEYHKFNRVSDKSDVYSYGVVLFRLISSQPSVVKLCPNYITLVDFAMGKILSDALEELVDLSLGFNSDNRIMKTVTAVSELAFQCVQLPKEIRPSMKQVLETLEGIKQGNWGFNQIT